MGLLTFIVRNVLGRPSRSLLTVMGVGVGIAAVVMLTGLAELAGAVALAQPWSRGLRRAGGIGLALYALCVWPANFQHFLLDSASADGGLGLAYHVPRLMAQPLVIWAALWAGGVADWPWNRRRPV